MALAKFGSSGVRGPYGSEVTPELALAIGRAVGSDHKRVVVGHDARTSSPLLAASVRAGLLSQGCAVFDAGLLPTPALAYAARRLDCGIMITASHNPAPDNGFKLWNPDGKAFDTTQRKRIETLLAQPGAPAPWARLGAVHDLPDGAQAHAEAVRAYVGEPARRLRIVLDCGNGAACAESPMLLRALGHDVVALNAQPDGRFPGRPSEPNETNLAHLIAAVRETGADLGLAHDGDADRAMAVADGGRFVTGDELCALLARHEARTRVVVPVDASLAVDDALPGVEVVRTRVGDAFVSEDAQRVGADWAGEPSGAWIFPRLSYCPDGPLAAAVVAKLVAEKGPLSALADALPRYPIARESVPVPNAAKATVLKQVEERLGRLGGKLTTLDGVRADLPEGWILVRASGTEPKIRITVEARRAEDVPRLMDHARAATRS